MKTMMQAMQRVLLQETCAEPSARIAFRLDDADDDVGVSSVRTAMTTMPRVMLACPIRVDTHHILTVMKKHHG